MKTLTAAILLVASTFLHAQEPEERMVLIPWGKVPKEAAKEAPLFFSTSVEVKAKVALEEVTSTQEIAFEIQQGKPETLSLALTGPGDVLSVTGAGLRDWSVRVGDLGARFLDIRPVLTQGKAVDGFHVTVTTRAKVDKGNVGLLLPAPGSTVGFSLAVTLVSEPGVDAKLTRADGLVPLADEKKPVASGFGKPEAAVKHYVGMTTAVAEISVSKSDSDARDVELLNVSLTGKSAADGTSVSFRLTGTVRAKSVKAAIELLGSGAALAEGVSGDGWHVALRKTGETWAYDLVAERTGDFPLDLTFEVPTVRQGDWRTLGFDLPAGVVVPVILGGLAKDVEFDKDLAVVPVFGDNHWRGFLPANGHAEMAWHPAGKVADGSLFFSSTETTDVRVGSGLLRQMTVVDLRVLQGKLTELSLALDGPAEVLSVSGKTVTGWSVRNVAGKRALDVKLARPIEGAERIVIEAQAALGGFPVKADALRMVPTGALRHSGWLRVANDGAVRIEVADAKGLVQLAPGQFPGGVDENLRQVFVYRFPSSDYAYNVRADQVLPEVGLTEVTVYELAETDRRVSADLELDIREAPLREWEIEIPADLAVASVTGVEVADFMPATEVRDGMRRLKIIFKRAVSDRQLVSVMLEKNEAAKSGTWVLQPLGFPGVKTRRGYIGAVATAGYRLIPDKTTGTAEVPVTFFPKKTNGLQQAFRLREDTWSASLIVESLGQSIQADVFHLYSLKAGAAYGSVLMNFFVVGAPATEWRISVPESIGNIDVTGQNVGRDWRRDGNTVIIPLSRPVLGTGTVLLTFEQPMNSLGGNLSPGEVKPLGVQGERGFVQVVSPLQVNHDSTSEGALLAIDPSELPAEFRLLSSAPCLGVWQYTARDFKIAMNIKWFEPGETVGQVVDFQKLSSRVSRDGQWVTDARIFVKTRGRGALRMVFPQGAVLWEAKVDGESVNARADGGSTLVPLPARLDPNQAVEVSLRYGARSASPTRPVLTAPRLDAPVVIGEWTVTGDEGRQLVPRGGTADLVRPVLAESGWEWLARNPGGIAALLLTGLAALVVGRGNASSVRNVISLACGIVFVVIAVWTGFFAISTMRAGSAVLEYAAPVVAADREMTVKLGNLSVWAARTGWGVWLGCSLGFIISVIGFVRKDRWWMACGMVLVISAFLSICGGAPLFFAVVALVGMAWWLPRVISTTRGFMKAKSAVATAVVSMWVIMSPWDARAETLQPAKPAESMVHDWQIRDGRLYGTVDVALRGEAGDRFLLMSEPAVLSSFEGAGLHVVKAKSDDADSYWVVMETSGKAAGKAVFEMPLADPIKGWLVPGGPAAMRRVTLRWDQGGWEFFSPNAAKTINLTGLKPDQSGATLVLGPADAATIMARPKQRDAASEETKFFAEVSNLFLPGPGVVNGRHLVNIRPAQGRVTSLTLKVPDGFTVSDVGDGPVGSWRFDPAKRELRIPVEPAQNQAFSLTVQTQRGAGALPVELVLDPIRVDGAAGEVGFMALAFGEEVQPEKVDVEGLSRVNSEDFNNSLLPRDKDGRALALLQHAFRYGTGVVKAKVKVTAVAPELRAESWQLVSLGEDRLVVATDLAVTITRSGVFRLELDVPEGLEIESATGQGLSHWTEAKVDGRRVVTLHLSGRTMGRRDYSITLTGRPTGAQEKWMVPRVTLRGASREIGTLTVVPERGLQVGVVFRSKISQLAPRDLADGPKEAAKAAARPGALAYRMLVGDSALGLSISRLDPWVTARVFHDATIREGQLLSRVHIGYKIENAAVKSQRIKITGLDGTSADTVRATGPAVADMVAVEGEKGLWEIRFQRGIVGETDVVLEYQRPNAGVSGELIEPVMLENVRQLTYFAAIRAGGRLELESGNLPRGWQRTDWSVVQSTVGRPSGTLAPAMAFRVADSEGPLPVVLKRHELADLRKLRVSQGSLTTLLSPGGESLTAVDLKMRVLAKGVLRLKLPTKAGLFNVFVNDEAAALVREGGDWLFHVFPSPEAGMPTSVRFVYSAVIGKGGRIEGPLLDVPMENLTWRVLVPEGWKLAGHSGDFDLKAQQSMGSFRLEDYQSFVKGKRESDAKSAVALLDQANGYLVAGDQEKAGLALGNAVRNGQLDAASGEDARIQLRELKTEQAVLGLNTRRQKVVLDNRISTQQQAQNPQLDRAAEVNPVLRGAYNYDPKQFKRFLEGNTADENTALKEIANRIVAQQLAAEPAPAALEVVLPERGTVLSFDRSMQVDGDRPMSIELDLKRSDRGFTWFAVLLCLLVGAMGVMKRRQDA